MAQDEVPAPDDTAVRVALWRALHARIDPPPHLFVDEAGLQLVSPGEDWRRRPDMDPDFTKPFRASIVGRARYVEDLVLEQLARGVDQYVILGAGLDTFALRRADLRSRLRLFEIDRPGPQAWKRARLIELCPELSDWVRLVPMDFEGGDSWVERLQCSGFDIRRPAIVASTGVSLYLTREANASTLRQVASLAKGSVLAMSFVLPVELSDPQIRPGLQLAAKGARASGTPFVSFFTPEQILELARTAGFAEVSHVSAAMLTERYFRGRNDGLRPPDGAEEILVATV